MTITRIDQGPRMSQAVIHNGLVWLAGQVGEGATVTEQTQDALARVDRLLEKAGTSKSKLLSVQVWVADVAHVAEMNAVYDAWIDPDNKPARACGESKLVQPHYKVEFLVVAAL